MLTVLEGGKSQIRTSLFQRLMRTALYFQDGTSNMASPGREKHVFSRGRKYKTKRDKPLYQASDIIHSEDAHDSAMSQKPHL
jgi:hypothetical protein